MPPDVIQLITVLGAAGMAIWIIKLTFVDNKIHSDSEVAGLKADKKTLFETNRLKDAALVEANESLKSILKIVQEDRDADVIALLNAIMEAISKLTPEETP